MQGLQKRIQCRVLWCCRASGKLANLTIRSTAAACITHMQGHLTIEVRPLSLSTPVMNAAGDNECPSLSHCSSPTEAGAIEAFSGSPVKHKQIVLQGCSLSCKGTGLNHLFSPIVTRASKSRPAHWLPSAEAPGVLKVVETKIRVWPPSQA